uniref:Uncharacterized protein n=1 Tax=Peronospora matthiolae TaxID=2874970 RepID=A0AAV1TRQ2_9STRA
MRVDLLPGGSDPRLSQTRSSVASPLQSQRNITRYLHCGVCRTSAVPFNRARPTPLDAATKDLACPNVPRLFRERRSCHDSCGHSAAGDKDKTKQDASSSRQRFIQMIRY